MTKNKQKTEYTNSDTMFGLADQCFRTTMSEWHLEMMMHQRNNDEWHRIRDTDYCWLWLVVGLMMM